ncbi:MAG: hypothetical protein M1611_01905 [Candidatus Marsarchaeota archaeon]|nr:hypothetical protein [Candidatus Marsarchaeota archaeon]
MTKNYNLTYREAKLIGEGSAAAFLAKFSPRVVNGVQPIYRSISDAVTRETVWTAPDGSTLAMGSAPSVTLGGVATASTIGAIITILLIAALAT